MYKFWILRLRQTCLFCYRHIFTRTRNGDFYPQREKERDSSELWIALWYYCLARCISEDHFAAAQWQDTPYATSTSNEKPVTSLGEWLVSNILLSPDHLCHTTFHRPLWKFKSANRLLKFLTCLGYGSYIMHKRISPYLHRNSHE